MTTRSQTLVRKRLYRWLSTFLVLILHQATVVVANNVTDLEPGICSCTPLVYNWKLDFTLSCPPGNVLSGNGTAITDYFCQIANPGVPNTDLVPVSIDELLIIELDRDLVPLKVDSLTGLDLQDGDIISFSSITSVHPYVISGGIQALLRGVNAESEVVEFSWIIRYSNLCFTPPFELDDSMGWMVFAMDVPPRPQTCFPPTSTPSTSPSLSSKPSSVPSVSVLPTNVPSFVPTKTSIPSNNPSSIPSLTPTAFPSPSPSARPSSSPSFEPSTTPPEPSMRPSDMSMSMSMSMEYDDDFTTDNSMMYRDLIEKESRYKLKLPKERFV